MNGTSADMLLDGYCEASLKVSEASRAISAIEFNARDYYTRGMETFDTARNEMQARQIKLQAVKDELDAIIANICEQKEEREARRRAPVAKSEAW